jgi:hypothetical protein
VETRSQIFRNQQVINQCRLTASQPLRCIQVKLFLPPLSPLVQVRQLW